MGARLLLMAAGVSVVLAGCHNAFTKPVPAVIGDWRNGATHCDVHDRDLQYDLQHVDQINTYYESAAARKELFPFASNDLWGNVDYAHVMYCSDCRLAKMKWIEEETMRNKGVPSQLTE